MNANEFLGLSAEGFLDDEPDAMEKFKVALKQGFVAPGNTLDRAVTGAALGLQHLVQGPNAEGDKLYQELQDRIKSRNQWANPDNVKTDIGTGIAGTLINTPQNLLTFPLTAFETGQRFLENGETLSKAVKATGIQTGANALTALLPPALKGSVPIRAATGAGINTAQYYGTQKALEFLSDTAENKQEMEPTWEGAAKAAGVGAAMGVGLGKSKDKPKARVEPTLPVKAEEFLQTGEIKPPIENTAQMELPDSAMIQAPQYGVHEGVGRVDENGMPVRADISMEAQNLQNPLQMNLWGDELGPGQGATRGLTDALDQLPKGIQRNIAMKQLGKNASELTSPDLNAAKFEADNALQPREGPFSLPESQRGAINMEMFDPAFEKIKELANGITLKIRGSETGPYVTAYKDGKTIGEVAAEAVDYANPTPRSNMESAGTWVAKDHQRQGVATEMYKFLAENGNDIVPSKAQMAGGKALWEGLEKKGISEYKRIGRSQRGGVDLHEISEGITKFFKPAKTPVDHMAKQPGMGVDGKDLIFVPKSGYEVLDQIKGEADGPKLFTNMQSGIMHASEKGNSTLVKTAGQWLQYGQRVGDWGVRNVVQPLEKTLSKFSTNEMIPLMEALKEEMFARKQMTPEELSARGLTARQVNAYRELRQVQAEALKRQNEGRVALGKEPITEQNAYLSSVFTGDYHIAVKDVDGKILWYIQQPSKGRANQAIKWLKENIKDVNLAPLKIEYRPGIKFGDVPRDMMGAYQEMIKLLDPSDPATAAIKEAMEQWATERGATVLGQQKHHTAKKANVRGFEGDQPWRTSTKGYLAEKVGLTSYAKSTVAKENAYNMAKAQIQYLQNAFRWAGMQEAMSQIKPMLSDPDIIAKQPNNIEITKAYMLNNMGVSKNMFKEFEAYAAENLGRSSSLVPGVVRDLKGITYAMQLGLSLGYWVATPLQLVAANLAWHADLGITSGKALKDISMSIVDGVAGIANEWSGDVSAGHFKDRVPMSKFGQEAAQWAEANGVINTNLYDDNRGLGGHKLLAAGEHAIGWTISKPEQFSRWVTFVGFARHLDSTGEFVGRRAEMFQRAAELTDNVATDMHRQARPLIVDKFGAAGEGMYIYKAPVFNMLNTLSIFARKAADGDAKPLLTYLAAMGVMGGVANLPFASELDGSLEFIKNFMAQHKPDWYKPLQGVSIKEAMLRNVPDASVAGTIANWGLASQVTGMNMSSRFNQSVIDVEHPFSGVAPLAQEGLEWLSAGNVALNPNRDTVADAMYINSPPLGKGLLESFHPSFKSGTKAQDGSWTGYRNPNHVTNPDTYVKRSPEEEQARLVGMTALSEGKRRTKDYINNQEAKRVDTAQKQLLEKFWSATQRDDPQAAATFVRKYAELGGDLNKLQPFIAQNVERLGMTQSEYNKVHAKTITQFNNILRRNELGK